MTEPTPLDPAPPADAPLVVAAFLARYLADQEAAGARPLAAYQALFPGHDALLAAEYARIVAGEPALEEVVGERLAGYRILGELGRGGQGVVYLALDERLGRKVALKVLPGAFGAAVARQRLLREAQAASRLDDPAICTVFDAGETGGIAYIAMRYVEGESLAARIARETRDGVARGEPARVRGLLLLFAAAARALHLAHEKGLVHRDLKPSNLMSDAEGKPVVLDFGLAHFDDHPDGTLTGDAVLGTPAYMSPEQLAAQEGRVDRRSDVFSLAVTLYEALTLQHPFAAPTRERLYQRLLGEEPAPARRLVPALPADLDVVLACALDKARDRRYATAQAFADDLQRIVERRPIVARPAPLRVQALRLVQRHPVASLAVAVAIVGLAAFAALLASHNRQLALALDEREVARQNAVHALHAEASARRRSDALRLASAATEVLPRDVELALLLSTEAVARSDDSQTRGALLGALSAFRPRPPLPGVSGATWVRVSGDGTRVAVPVGDEVWLFDAATHTRVAVLACREARHAEVWWSSDARRLVLAVDNQLARIAADGSATRDYPAFLCDGGDGRVLAPLAGHRGRLHAVVFAKAQVLTASGRVLEGTEGADARGEVRVWALADGAPLWQRSDLPAGVRDARFDIGIDRGTVTPDVDVLTDEGAYLRLRGADGATTRERRVFAADERPRPTARLLPAGRVAVAAAEELRLVDARGTGTARVVPSRGGNHVYVDAGAVLRWSTSAPHALEFGVDESPQVLPTLPQELIAVWGGMRTVARGEFHVSFATTTLAVQTIEGVFVDGTVRSWRADTGEFVDLPPVGGQVVAAHASETGEVIATVGLDGRVRVFAREGAVVLPRVPGLDERAWEALHPSGARVLAVVADQPTALDSSRGAAVWSLPAEDAQWQLAAYAPSGEFAAFGADDGTVWIVRADDGARVATLVGNDQPVRGLAFSPDGRHLAVARGDLTVADARTGAIALRVSTPVPLTTVQFAAGGTRLVAAGAAGHRVFTFPEGAPGDGLALDAPQARPGVPVAVAGDRVLLSRELAVPGHRVGGAGPAAILDARDGSVRELTGAAACWAGALAPDAARAVLPRDDGALLLVDVATGSVTELPGHDRAANCVRFSADGRCFASGFAAREFGGAHDERAVVVRAVDGGELLRIEVPSGVRWFDLDAAGEWLVVKAGDGELARYPVRAVDFAARLGLRALTPAERARYALAAEAPR